MNRVIDYERDLSAEMITIEGGFNNIRLAVWSNEGKRPPHFHFYKGVKPEQEIPYKDLEAAAFCYWRLDIIHMGRIKKR
jgi:hypothetical protein